MTKLDNKYEKLFTEINFPDETQIYNTFPFKKISLITSPCFGTCPVYELTLYRNGKAEFNGVRYVTPEGKYKGRFDFREFGKLCLIIEKLNILDLENNYSVDWTDDAGTIVKITAENGYEKVIDDYGNSGPIELFALQKTLMSFKNSIKWEKTET